MLWARGLLVATGVYGGALVGFGGSVRYQATAYVLQPGVDVRREHQALLALSDGAARARQGDLAAAEQSLLRALRLWEELAPVRPAPSRYRANLAITLYDLGWVRDRQGREDEAEKYYARAVALADEVAGDPALDVEFPQFKPTMAGARQALADLRSDAGRARQAWRALTEGLAQFEKGELPSAEQFFQRSLRLWEALTAAPGAPPDYWANRAGTLYNLGLVSQRQGREAEAKTCYAGVVALADRVAGGPPMDDKFREAVASARKALADLNGDSRREQQALLALTNGTAQLDKGDLHAAEKSFQESLRLWEVLTAAPAAPPAYRVQLAFALNNLGWIGEQQGRWEEAEKYYARVASLGPGLPGGAEKDDQLEKAVAYARSALAGLRGSKLAKLLAEKDRAAARACEEADVKAQKPDAEAEPLYRQAITLWEEVVPQAKNETYQKSLVARLTFSYLRLGRLQQQLGKRAAAETTAVKAIDYGEKALSLEPDRPLLKHNLELARDLSEQLREQALHEEVTRLYAEKRFADGVDRYLRCVQEQEEQVRTAGDRKAATRWLAYRLDRLAWLLASCPDACVRDTRGAVEDAGRAVALQPDVQEYQYTLATVQYRNGDWQDSLASLEKLKTREGGFDARGWLLIAMNRHQLKQRDEARLALRKADEWVEEQQRKAEGNPLLRYQYETMRPRIEAFHTGQEIAWDDKAGKVANVPQANRFLGREYRKGWEL
jgi:tetratricopeptide (TPR) repeat protein